MVSFLRHCLLQEYFSASNERKQNSNKNLKIVEDTT